MQCPVDGSQLTMSDRQGIEIDYCPKCRGVWLDRGEIDKIVERSMGQGAPQNYPQQQQGGYDEHRERRDYDDDDDHHGYDRGHGQSSDQHNQKKHKRESWFGELFE